MRTAITAAALLALAASTVNAQNFFTINGQSVLARWDASNLTTPISGALLNAGTTSSGAPIIVGLADIDFRPSNGLLYGIDSTGIYTINTSTGFCTLVGPLGMSFQPIAMDFNPQTDEIRAVGTMAGVRKNVRINPDTGAIISVDSNFIRADNPAVSVNVAALAHTTEPGGTRLFAGYLSGSPTAFHTFGEVGSLAGGNPSFNAGAVTTVGQSGLEQYGLYTPGGFDIAAPSNTAYFAFSFGTGGGRTVRLGTVNLATGLYTDLGQVGSASFASNTGLAIVPPPPCDGDANNDNTVDGADLSVLLGQFGTSVTPGTGADFNNDGLINAADLSVLLASFGSVC